MKFAKTVSMWKALLILFSVSLITLSLSSCRHRSQYYPGQNAFQQQLADTNNYVVIKGNAVGTSYGWSVCLIKVVGASYSQAIDNLWENAGISDSDRAGCSLVNIKVDKGTAWGVIVVGQTYITVTADIVKLKSQTKK